MEVRVLGPLEVHHHGVPNPVGGTKVRELLALLAIRPNEPISPEALIDELWEGEPPATAASALRVHIARVREVLEPTRAGGQSTRLPLERAGYVLRLSADELDALQFEDLVARGREAGVRGDAAGAEDALTAALGYWRGPALLDVRSFSAAHGAIARLDELRLSAVEELGEASLALGKHADIVDVLLQTVRDFPLAERLTAQLMLALYRCGRQAEALRAFSALSRRLDDELGTKPSAELRQLEEDVLLQRERLDFVRRDAPPVARGDTASTGPRLVGRRAELAALLEAYDAAAAGTRRLALVSGAAGIGKTALIAEHGIRVGPSGGVVLSGSCTPEGFSHLPIAEILSAALPLLDPDTRAIACEEIDLLRGTAVSTAPASSCAGRDYASEQLRLIDGVARTISSLPGCPVVVVEDLHWADPGTLYLVRQLLRHRDIDRLLVIGTYRDEQLDERRAAMISRLAPRADSDAIHLKGLDDHEVRSLVRATVGPQVVPALLGVAVTLRDATNGNPFHLRALLEELDAPVMASIDDAELTSIIENLAPQSVRALVDERARRLSDEAQYLARAAATIAREISPELLAEVCALDPDSVTSAIDELVDARLMSEDLRYVERFEFSHALVRNAVYWGIPDDERALLHLRVGEIMETVNESWILRYGVHDLARHFVAAGDHGEGKAAYYAERAGHAAAARLAFSESAIWYEAAIERSAGESAATVGRLLLALAESYEAARQPEKARDACIRGAANARAADDPVLFADIALAASATWASGFELEAWTRSLLEEALSELSDSDPGRQLRLLARLATSFYYIDAEREGRLVNEACKISETMTDRDAWAEALLARRLWLTHQPTARRERLAVAENAKRQVGDTPTQLSLRVSREMMTDLLENGEFERFGTELDRYERDAREISSPLHIYWAMALRATQATLHGDLASGEQLARGAALRGSELQQRATGAEFLQRFVIRYQQRRLAEMLPDRIAGVDTRGTYRGGSALNALAYAETGRIEEATRIAKWAVGPDGRGIAPDAFWLGAHALLTNVAVAAEDEELAAILEGLIGPCADHIVTFGAGGAVLGTGHHWLGLLASTRGAADRAVEHLTAAEAISESMRAPYWRAQAQFDLARVLSRRNRPGDRKRARQLTTDAITVAEQGGFDRLLPRP